MPADEAAAVETITSLPGPDGEVLEFETPDRTGKRPWQHMTVDGHPVMVREPKSAFFLSNALMLLGDDEAASIKATDDLLTRVFDEDSQAHLRERLEDDDDDFDTDDLGDILLKLQELWGKGRGGSSKNSPPSSRRRSQRSTARRR